MEKEMKNLENKILDFLIVSLNLIEKKFLFFFIYDILDIIEKRDYIKKLCYQGVYSFEDIKITQYNLNYAVEVLKIIGKEPDKKGLVQNISIKDMIELVSSELQYLKGSLYNDRGSFFILKNLI